MLQIRDAYPKLLLARTRNEDTDYEGIRIVDIPQWLLMDIKELVPDEFEP